VAILVDKLTTEVDEAGDTIATARLLTLVDNQVAFSGIIATRTDVDFLRLNAPAAGTLVVTVSPWFSAVNTNGNNLDVELLVFNSVGTLIGSHSPSDVASASVTVNVAAGAHYIRIDGVRGGTYSDYGSLGQYNMQATFVAGGSVTTTQPSTAGTTTTTTRRPCPMDELESNNDIYFPTIVNTLPFTHNLSICPGDEDVFAVKVCPGGKVQAALTFVHSDGNLDLHLVIGVRVRSSSRTLTDNEVLSYKNTGKKTKTAKFQVLGYRRGSNPSYQINITQVQDCRGAELDVTTTREATTAPPIFCQPDALESNNDIDSATIVTALPFIRNLSICAGDQDFFTVDVCTGGQVQAVIAFMHNDGDLDMDILVAGAPMRSADSSTNSEVLNTGTSPGTAHFLVYGFNGVGNPNYQISFTQVKDCNDTTTLAPTTTTAAPTTTTSASIMCSCSGRTRTTNARNKNYNFRFRAACTQGHRFRFCLEPNDRRSSSITAVFQRRVGRRFQGFQAKQTLGGNKGDKLCYAVDLPASVVGRNERYRLRVVNGNRRRYKIQTGVMQVRSSSCNPLV